MQFVSKSQQVFCKHKQANSKIYIERYRLNLAKNILTKTNKVREITLSNGRT